MNAWGICAATVVVYWAQIAGWLPTPFPRVVSVFGAVLSLFLFGLTTAYAVDTLHGWTRKPEVPDDEIEWRRLLEK